MNKMQELYQKVAGDPTLQEKFNQIMANAEKEGVEATEQKLLQFAKTAGYEIEIAEMQEYFKTLSEEKEGELSVAELDQVAGGKSVAGTMTVMASIISAISCALGSAIGEIIQPGGCAGQFK